MHNFSKKPTFNNSDRLIANSDFIIGLGKTSSARKRMRLIHNATTDQLLALIESAWNILNNRKFCLKKRQLHRLRDSANNIRALSRARTAKTARKILLESESLNNNQIGKGLPATVIPVAGLLANILLPLLIRN